MNGITEVCIILMLLAANGVFAMSEIAIVSSRKGLLRKMAEDGSRGAKVALGLAENPEIFLSTVQVGITLVGIVAGAFGGATLSGRFEGVLVQAGLSEGVSGPLSIVLVVGAITFLSIVIGELVPKRVALGNPERWAALVARPMRLLSRAASPLVWLLSRSSGLVLRLMGLGGDIKAPPSEEEVSYLMDEGTSAGVFHKRERHMVEGVLRLDECPVTDIMTHRTKIVWLDIDDPDEVNWRKIVASGHSHFPVFKGSRDNVMGMIDVKALWANAAAGAPGSIRANLSKPFFVPETLNAMQLLELFRAKRKQRALVTDEFGGVEGLVSIIDVAEDIVGDLPEPGTTADPDIVRREDGSYLVNGSLPIGELRRRFDLPTLPGEGDAGYVTLGGFVAETLGHIPQSGEYFDWNNWRFEVVDMDRHRVDKVLMSRK